MNGFQLHKEFVVAEIKCSSLENICHTSEFEEMLKK